MKIIWAAIGVGGGGALVSRWQDMLPMVQVVAGIVGIIAATLGAIYTVCKLYREFIKKP